MATLTADSIAALEKFARGQFSIEIPGTFCSGVVRTLYSLAEINLDAPLECFVAQNVVFTMLIAKHIRLAN
ncbi:hypothetical protein EYC98_06885 [Halieaceae bacterium IMCC14734]|uniref:Uncharacterized protein n=1 Tax=Candidatus Litorirhabdus singularis TaxID=2518993 RepID=A0ABT3TF13_9GAMM|nr:hypothetical protein [Candidatus Litorirhabdus singularis]MCX2980599.1 hypothetical protein [Candidatus Litorirhabdus singularis]